MRAFLQAFRIAFLAASGATAVIARAIRLSSSSGSERNQRFVAARSRKLCHGRRSAGGSGFIQLTEDNGSPDRTDRSQTILVPNPPATCPAPTQPALVLAKGNCVVKDAT
jgi:hypothetical protein